MRKFASVIVIALLLLFVSSCIPTNIPPLLVKAGGLEGIITLVSNTFAWIGTDADGIIAKYEYKKDGGIWEDNALATTYTWNGYARGVHIFEVRAKDNRGAYSNVVMWTFNYDAPNQPPVVNKLGGAEGAITSPNNTFSWSGTDDVSIIKYEYRKDGGGWINHALNTSYTWSGYAGGNHTFEVRAQDNEGLYSAIVTWTFTYETPNQPPVITNVGGLEGSTLEKTNIFGWSGNDPDGSITKYQYRKDSGSWVNHGMNTSYTWNAYLTGLHTFEVRAQDNKGAYSNILKWTFEYIGEPYITWQKCLGGSENESIANFPYASIQQTTDGGYIVAGYTESNDGNVSGNKGNTDIWVVRLDGTGNILWQRCLGGSGYEFGASIVQTTDGGFVLAGITTSTDGDVSGNQYGAAVWIVKLDGTGNILWQRCLGGSSIDWPYSIQQTADGGYIVAGYTESNDGDVSGNHGGKDAWVVKLDGSGNKVWQRCLGGSGTDMAYSIQQTADGGYIVAGGTDSNNGDVSGNHGGADAWVVKLDGAGNKVWQRCFGGSDVDIAFSIRQTTDGGYIFAGGTNSNNGDVSGYHGGDGDIWVVKLDSAGNKLWQRCLGGSGIELWLSSVEQTSDGGYVVIGTTGSNDGNVSGNKGLWDVWVVKLNSTGSLVWQKCLGGTSVDYGFSIQQTFDGGYVLAGLTASNDGDVSGNHGGIDIWVAKLK